MVLIYFSIKIYNKLNEQANCAREYKLRAQFGTSMSA